jgi:L-arabinose isomerase
MKALDEFEIWFLTGSQGMYGEEILAQVRAHAREIAEHLTNSDNIPVRVVGRQVVTTPEEIERVCLEANAAPGCVGVVAWMHTFSPAKMWIAGMLALGKPLLHLHTQANRDLPWGEIDMDFMNLNQAAHGDREFAYILSRLRVTRTVVVGHWQDPAVTDRIATWARAAAARQELKRLKVARFGDNMRHVAVTEGDKVEAQTKLGVSVNTYGITDLSNAMTEVSEGEIDRTVGEYDDLYLVSSDLGKDGDRRASLRYAARIEVALRSLLEAGGFMAFTDTFEDLGGLEQLPGIAVQRLMADGYGFGAEGDWKTATLVRAMKVLTAGLAGGTSFMEDYTYHLGDPAPRVLGAHMLEVCPSIAGDVPSCEIHPLSIGGKGDPVRLVFTARPGPGIVVGLIDLGNRFRLVANEVELVEPNGPMPKLPVARAVWEPQPDFRTAVSGWLLAGGSHHTSLSVGIGLEPLIDLAEMLGIELVAIGAGSSLEQLKNEMRWNRLFYGLVDGL